MLYEIETHPILNVVVRVPMVWLDVRYIQNAIMSKSTSGSIRAINVVRSQIVVDVNTKQTFFVRHETMKTLLLLPTYAPSRRFF